MVQYLGLVKKKTFNYGGVTGDNCSKVDSIIKYS